MIALVANRFLDLVQRWGWMLGCVLVAIIFVVSGWGKLMNPQGTAAFMRDAGIPLSGALVYVVIAVELLGGIALAVGFRRQSVALLLLLFLAVVTLSLHNFWHYAGQEQQGQFVQFLKNTAILGGLLFLASAHYKWKYSVELSLVCRSMIALIFFMNAFGVVNQERSAHELVLAGAPEQLAPLLIRAGQVAQAIGGVLLLFPKRLAVLIGALLLAGFMVPATLTAHAFWSATPDMYSAQLTNFLKNTAIVGSVLTVAGYFAQLAERFGSKGTAKADVAARVDA